MASAFTSALAERRNDPAGRRWVYVPYDQLCDRIGPLAEDDPSALGIVMIESRAKAARRPYHKQKLALVLANQRRFALEQAERGVAVHHVAGEAGYADALRGAIEAIAPAEPLRVMEPAERELRIELQPLVDEGLLEILPHAGWLTTRDQFERSQTKRPWRMDAFYRLVRRESGVLMDGKKPVGGKFSFDADNRKPWRGEPPAPELPTFPGGAIETEVAELIETRFADHPGRLDLEHLPTTADDARRLWSWAVGQCLPTFGPYEDAMSTRSTNLFHTRVSSLVNIHRLLPGELVADAASLEIPLAGQEGFIRQILGWREFVRHVHVATDGFRTLDEDVGDPPSFLGADTPLPPVFWGDAPSGMACLDRVVADVWDEAYSHHITRLMILSNLATLLDLSPRELTDWFWVAYSDAYDWVVEPNVLGMGTFAVGELMTTKPYVSGAAYIDRMSDYCSGCRFDPKKTCPVTPLYWAFLDRQRERLETNPRLRMPFASLRKRATEKKEADRAVFESVRERLGSGLPLHE